MIIQEKELFENFEIEVKFNKFNVIEIDNDVRKLELSTNNITSAIDHIMRRIIAKRSNTVSIKEYFQFIKAFTEIITQYSK